MAARSLMLPCKMRSKVPLESTTKNLPATVSNTMWVGSQKRLVEVSAELTASSCPLELAGRRGAIAPAVFTYQHDDLLGIRFELVDAAAREAMQALFEPQAPEG